MKKRVIASLGMLIMVSLGLGVLNVSGNRLAFAATPVTVKAPDGLHTKKKSTSSIRLTWKKSKDASGYVIYRRIKGKYRKVKTINKAKTTKWINKKLKKNKIYAYKMKAYKKVGEKKVYSPFSYKVSSITNTKKYGTFNASDVILDLSFDEYNEKESILPLGEKCIYFAHPVYIRGKKYGYETIRDLTTYTNNSNVAYSDRGGSAVGCFAVYTQHVGTCKVTVRTHNGIKRSFMVRVKSYVKPKSFKNLDKMSPELKKFLLENENDLCKIIEELAPYRTESASFYLWKGKLNSPKGVDLRNCKTEMEKLLTTKGLSEIRMSNQGGLCFIYEKADGTKEKIAYFYDESAHGFGGIEYEDIAQKSWKYIK